MKKKFITAAIPYSNGLPHLGHAYEYVLTDSIARYHRVWAKDDVLMSLGMDENAQKNVQKAKELGISTQELVDSMGEKFKELHQTLQMSNDFFIKTTSVEHRKAAGEVWNRLVKNGYIYKKTYTGLYCIGCETFKTEKDLTPDGLCPDHLKKPEEVAEENYFFKLTEFKDKLIDLISNDGIKIVPTYRKSEMLNFLNQELFDVSFSRPEKLLNWGIKVPGDETQVIYVWCDALINYITVLGFPESDSKMSEFWNNGETLHVIGKDILRFHSIYWPAMLLGADLPIPKEILAHGHIQSNGQKMSKSLGNVVGPMEIVDKYDQLKDKSVLGDRFGSEVFRYYFLKNINPHNDGDFTWERLRELYNADLANGLGNLVSRVMKLSEKYLEPQTDFAQVDLQKVHSEFANAMKEYDVMNAMNYIWKQIGEADNYMQTEQPFKVVKVDLEKGKQQLQILREKVYTIARLLNPFMPTTSEVIKKIIKENKMPEMSLFPRYE